MKTRVTPSAVPPVEVGERRLRALISAETLDREGEVLLAEGAELTNYRRNPVVLWAHHSELPPVGRATTVEVEPGVGVWAENEFASSPFAQEIFELYRSGFLHAFSVGFRPLELSRRAVCDGQRGPTIVRWELVEQSAVAVPANPDALVTAAGGGNRAAEWLLKTYYGPREERELLGVLGLSDDPAWPELAAATYRFFGARGGVTLTATERVRCGELLGLLYQQRGLRFPVAAEPADPRPRTTEFFEREPQLFEEHEMRKTAALVRGRALALRNIARKRRRRGEPLPELDPLHEAAAYLTEVTGGVAVGAPSDETPGNLTAAVRELRETLAGLRDERDTAIAAALDDLRRGAIGGHFTT